MASSQVHTALTRLSFALEQMESTLATRKEPEPAANTELTAEHGKLKARHHNLKQAVQSVQSELDASIAEIDEILRMQA
jgi:predicted  nucleic acid-binding Zn-ribbon protein